MAKKKEIDEQKFLAGIMERAERMNRGDYSGISLIPEKEGTEKSEPEVRNVPQIEKEYADLFLGNSPALGQFGKNVRIRTEYHFKIRQLLFCFSSVNLSGFIDNVLREHFYRYRDEIDKLINDSEFFKKLKK